MTPIIFHLITSSETLTSFSDRVATLGPQERPIYVGECRHWIREPTLSKEALVGAGPTVNDWRFLVIYSGEGPAFTACQKLLGSNVGQSWVITAEGNDDFNSRYEEGKQRRANAVPPSLPSGWSAQDGSGLKATVPPSDLEFSLGGKSYRLGASKDHEEPVILADALGAFGATHEEPVFMLNILSSNPGQRGRTYAYIEHFGATVGPKHGGEGILLGQVEDWTSRSVEGELTMVDASKVIRTSEAPDGPKVGWEDVALVYYPSVWYFAKLLDDPEYAEADRKYKGGALRDGPILMCTEVHIKYQE